MPKSEDMSVRVLDQQFPYGPGFEQRRYGILGMTAGAVT
jgi:hypothetical protein